MKRFDFLSRLSLQKRFIFALISFTALIIVLGFCYYAVIYYSFASASASTLETETGISGMTLFLTASIAVFAILLVAVAILYIYLSGNIVKPMTSVIGGVASLDGELSGRLHKLPVAGKSDFESLVFAINRMLDRTEQFSRELLDERQKLFEAELLQRDMRIGLLTLQIDAHFVVNTITSIHTLSMQGDNERAGRMADGLAQVIKHRYIGDNLCNVFVELEMAEVYIEIMNIRYNGRFIAEYEVEDGLVEYLMPGLVLQPVIENALTHGLTGNESETLLRISGYMENDTVYIKVFDNGIGIERNKLDDIKSSLELNEIGDFPEPGLSGIALSNLQKRIQLWFGRAYGLSIESVPGEGTTVTIKLPAIMEK